ncbi:hypothetical protein ACFL1N_02060 [Thermodesulfobacteriota bacterium]
METSKAILAFSQSEKIKEGILWASNIFSILDGLHESEKKGAEKVIHALVNMIGQEIRLARMVSGMEAWDDVEPHIDKAVLMINSGVGREAVEHLSKALSMVTTIGQRAMSVLKDRKLV